MRMICFALCCFLFLGLFTLPSFLATSSADLLVYEPFDYEPGDLHGQFGGVGFDESWNVSDDEFIQVVEPSTPMSFTLPGGETVSGGNRALQFANETDLPLENDPQLLSRALDVPLESDDLYFSYLYRYTNGEINDNDFVVWWFNDFNGPNIGLKGNRGDGSGPEDLMARMRNFAPQIAYHELDISEEEGTIGQDFFVVGHLHRAGNSDDPDDYDQYDLWINPSVDEEADPHVISFADPIDAYLTEVFALGMRAFSQEPGDAMMWDELRIGTTWEDVVSGLGAPQLSGDFDNDGLLTVADINQLTVETASGADNVEFDLNDDNMVDFGDINEWVLLANTWIGDANLDGEFNSTDFVSVFSSGKFETEQAANWSEGDWDGDGQFSTSDFVVAFSDGGFEQGPRAAAQQVPEPGTCSVFGLGACLIATAVGRRRNQWAC